MEPLISASLHQPDVPLMKTVDEDDETLEESLLDHCKPNSDLTFGDNLQVNSISGGVTDTINVDHW